MNELIVASLEVSTVTAKCILFSLQEGVIAEASKRYGPEVADGPSQDPHGVLACALDVLREVVLVANQKNLTIEAVGLVGIWHSLLLLDDERRALGKIRTWVDLAGADHAMALRQDQGLVHSVYQKTGCMLHAMYPAWKWHYLKQSAPQVTGETTYLSSQTEFVFESLTGQAAVSRTLASGTGFLNIHALDWDQDLLEMMGLSSDQFSQLVEAFHTAPMKSEMAQLVGLPSGIPVTVGSADGAMNQLAVGGLGTEVMSMSVGTSGALRVAHLEPRIPDEPSSWCYYLLEGRRLAGAAINNGTNCVDWFLIRHGNRLNSDTYDRYSNAVGDVDGLGAPMFMPFLYGERCPGWAEHRTGGFVDLKASHGEYDLYYSVLEGILFNMRQCYDILVDVGGIPKEVLVSGGIVNSSPWMQMAADILQREVMVTGSTNDSTVGGALVALEAVGGHEQVRGYRPPIARRFEPRADGIAIHDSRYARYLELYRLLG
ncbi:MAG: hypothetical protein GX986_07050 [Firmicutes bacterium]|mgnify:CR=1 FL=1|nr:hypothetical protein [Bacillota bacterium]